MQSNSTIKHWVIAVAFCLSLLSVFGVYKFLSISAAIEEQASQPEYFETVEVFMARVVDYTPTVKALGVVVTPQQVSIRNELPGYITEVNFESGATVEKGQVIIQMDISEQRANLKSAKARAKLAQTVYDRDVELLVSNAVSQEVVDRSRSELDVVSAEIAAINSVINRRTLRAPFSGVIGIHELEPGQYLDANTLITNLVGSGPEKWIDFSVPQFYGELSVGTTIRARLVRSHLDPGALFEGTIIAGNSQISSEARSRLYRALVNVSDIPLLHNASVEVEVPVGIRQELIAVPAQAVQSNVQGQYVYVLDPESSVGFYRARAISVSLEVEQGNFNYVVGALQADDIVAAAGAFKLREGVLVQAKSRPDIAHSTGGE